MSDNSIDNNNASHVDHDLQNSPTSDGVKAKNSARKATGPARFGKVKTLSLGLVILILVTIGGGWLMFGSGGQTKLKIPVADRRGVSANSPPARSIDNDAESAIAEARRTAQGDGRTAATPLPGIGAAKPNVQNSPQRLSEAHDLEGAIGSKSAEASSGTKQDSPAKPQPRLTSQANAEKSFFFDSNTTAVVNHNAAGNSSGLPVRQVSTSVIAKGPVLPSFGSILPVRALGAIYTLRTGGLLRLELTRRVEGPTWELDKGTVLVGTLRGSESDRAFISIVGFIDPVTEHFVKFGGNVLGTDGGDGLKGKRRKIGGGWSKALGQAGSSAMGLAQSFASRGTTIILPNINSAASPYSFDTSRPREFVEIAAGTQGYVMVTDLPREIKGVDTLESMSRSEIARASDPGARSDQTGLSENEMVDLLTNGSPEQIRAALPRMTPAMRRIAESVLAEGGQ